MTAPAAAQQRRVTLRRIALALGLGFAAALPLLLRGASCGQDFDFHLQSWLAVRAAWHAGGLVPHWVTWANYGAGEPRFAFYPPLSWLLGALLSLLLPWAWVPWAFTAVCIAGAGWMMHRAAVQLCAGAPALVAAGAYALSPYLLFCAYERGALAELLAAVWMPPLFAALLAPRLPVLRTAMLLAALWYTNAPAAVMGSYLVLLALAWRTTEAVWQGRRQAEISPGRVTILRLWLRGTAALLFGCALAADYLLPAWYDQRFVAIHRAVGPGMRIRDSFLFEHTGAAYHDQVLHTASWIAVLTLLTGAFCALLLLVEGTRGDSSGSRTGYSAAPLLGVTVLACALLQLHPSEPVWRSLPELAFLQFPWRLLLPASAAVALLLELLIELLLESPRSRLARGRPRAVSFALLPLLGLALIFWADRTRFQPCDDEDNVAAQLLLPSEAQNGNGGGFEGTDEYAAASADNGEIQQGLPRVRLLQSPDAGEGDDSTEANPAWTPDRQATVPGAVAVQAWGLNRRAVRVAPTGDAFAVLRLERFPAWRVALNGRPCGAACVPREDGLVTVAVPGGHTSLITAAYSDGWPTWAGRMIALAALLVAVLAALLRAKPRGLLLRTARAAFRRQAPLS